MHIGQRVFLFIFFFAKSVLHVPDIGTRVLYSISSFSWSTIACFWMTPVCSKECEYHMFQYSPILQSCTKLLGTHALLIVIMFIIKMYVYKMTCMIQYPCSKYASPPSFPHQAMLVYTCLLFIPTTLSLTTLILGSGARNRVFYYKMSQQFFTKWWNLLVSWTWSIPFLIFFFNLILEWN